MSYPNQLPYGDSTYVISPPPIDGQLQPGTTYTFTFTLTNPLAGQVYLPIFQGTPAGYVNNNQLTWPIGQTPAVIVTIPNPFNPSNPYVGEPRAQINGNVVVFTVPIGNNFIGPYWIPNIGSRPWDKVPDTSSTPRFFWSVQNQQLDVACYLKGTKILCLTDDIEAYTPIENMIPGQLVKTLNHGYVPVKHIASTMLYQRNSNLNPKNKMYVLRKENYPELVEDLYITGGHSIMVDNLSPKETEDTNYIWKDCLKIDDKYKLLTMINNKAEVCEDGNYEIYHLVLDGTCESYCIYANGILSETMSESYLLENSNLVIRNHQKNLIPEDPFC